MSGGGWEEAFVAYAGDRFQKFLDRILSSSSESCSMEHLSSPSCLIKDNFLNWIISPLARLDEKNIPVLFSSEAVSLGYSFCSFCLTKQKIENNFLGPAGDVLPNGLLTGTPVYLILITASCTSQAGNSLSWNHVLYPLLNRSQA